MQKQQTLTFRAVPCISEVESDTLEGVRFVAAIKAATKHSTQILEQSSKFQARGVAREVLQGLLLAQTLL